MLSGQLKKYKQALEAQIISMKLYLTSVVLYFAVEILARVGLVYIWNWLFKGGALNWTLFGVEQVGLWKGFVFITIGIFVVQVSVGAFRFKLPEITNNNLQ